MDKPHLIKLLKVAARALAIAHDNNLETVQAEAPLEWGLSGGEESAKDGWVSTYELAEYLEDTATCLEEEG